MGVQSEDLPLSTWLIAPTSTGCPRGTAALRELNRLRAALLGAPADVDTP